MSPRLEDVARHVMDGISRASEEFVPAGPGRLVLVLRVRASARGSHVPIDQRIYAPWESREGKPLRGRTFPSRREALEAAGLRE